MAHRPRTAWEQNEAWEHRERRNTPTRKLQLRLQPDRAELPQPSQAQLTTNPDDVALSGFVH